MEYNRYNHNKQFNRGYHPRPYERGPTQRGRDSHRSYNDHYNNRGPERSHKRQDYSNNNRHRLVWDNQQYSERTFDNKGRSVVGNPSPQFNSYTKQDARGIQQYEEASALPESTPLEKKARGLLQSVLNQEGIRSNLIFLETVENALQTLQGTVDNCQLQMTVEQNSSGEFVLRIGNEVISKGVFPNKQAAKNALAEQALEILRKDCFYIIKKKEYEEISTKMNQVKEESKSQTSFEGSKAHQMMLKMGWGGKGLGVNEQGGEKTVAETIDQNISRQGLGADNVFKKIHQLLEDYSKSDKMSLLKFDPDFSSEERAHIHKIANKFGLKSKSEGKGEQRRITITKKLHRGDLVYNLLTCGLENTLYKLSIPARFEYLWHDDGEGDEDEESFQPSFLS